MQSLFNFNANRIRRKIWAMIWDIVPFDCTGWFAALLTMDTSCRTQFCLLEIFSFKKEHPTVSGVHQLFSFTVFSCRDFCEESGGEFLYCSMVVEVSLNENYPSKLNNLAKSRPWRILF